MAVARRIQTLLAVNILVFVGIVLFSAYCRLQDRAGRRAQLVRGADRRARSRIDGAGAGTDREAILRRLGHLEEVVYNQLNGVDFGDVSERLALRRRLKCRSFQWYLENVYPEMRVYSDTLAYGEVRNSKASGYCLDQGSEDDDQAILYPCHGMSSQLVRYSTDGLLQLGPLGSTAFLPDSKCLVDDGGGRSPALRKCEDVARPTQRLWDFTQSSPIVSRDTGRCLEVEMAKEANFGLRLVVQKCSGQKWVIRNWVRHRRH